MQIKDFIEHYCDSTEKKGNGLSIHRGHVPEDIEGPDLFKFAEDWSMPPERKIWTSDSYQMVVACINGELTVYEHLRRASYKIQLIEEMEKYAPPCEKDLTDLADVFNFAHYAHRNQTRKSGVAYISHPMDVAAILIRDDAPADLVFAGLLHDVVEDAGVDLRDISRRYGSDVARYVEAVTEPMELKMVLDRSKTWKQRKEHTIEYMKDADRQIRLLCCADKLSNIKDLLTDLKMEGEIVWERFNGSKKEMEWYFSSLLDAFGSGTNSIEDTRAYLLYKEAVEELLQR